MIDTQSEAIEFINKVQLAAQKAKSVIGEIAEGNETMMKVVADLNPGLFPQEGKLDIVEVTMRLQAKNEPVTRTDILNLLVIGNRIGPAFLIETAFYQIEWPDDPMVWFSESQLPIM